MPRNTKKADYLTTRVSKSTKAQIQAIARDERRTLSQVVALLVEQAIEARQVKQPAAD